MVTTTGLCVLTHRDQGEHPQDVGLLCGWHRGRLDWLHGDVSRLDGEFDLLREAGTAPKDQAGKGRKLKNPTPPAPANLDWIVLHDRRSHGDVDGQDDRSGQPSAAIEFHAEVYATRVRDERPLSQIVLRPVRHADSRVFDVPTTVPAVLPSSYVARLDLIARHHDWIAEQEWVDEYWDDLNGLHRALRRAVRDYPPVIPNGLSGCYIEDGNGEPCRGDLQPVPPKDGVRCSRDRSHRWDTPLELARLQIILSKREQARKGKAS